MEKIINLIENKNLDEILNYSKSLTDDERFSLIIFFEVSTPISPPNSPPIIDFVFSN